MRLSCIHEEITQGLGLANDSPLARPSIFNDDEEFALLTPMDELMLKMLYSPRLSAGMTETEARPHRHPPCRRRHGRRKLNRPNRRTAMIFDFLKGEFIDVIAWTDDTRDTMVWRFERRGNAIKYGAKLTVREGQAAVFIHEGQLADVFGPGLYMLETNNLPILTTLQHWDHGFQSPFKSEIYFVNTTRFNDLKWGTKNPIMTRDPEFGPIRLRAFGTYSMRVIDPGRFMTEIVGTDGEFTADEISFQIRNVILQEVSRVLASSNIPVLDMAANTKDLGNADHNGHRAANRGIRPRAARVLHREHLASRGRGKGARQAHLGRCRGRSEEVHGVQHGRGDGQSRQRRRSGDGDRNGCGHRHGHGGTGRAMGRAPIRPAPAAGRATAVWHIAENGATTGPFPQATLVAMAGAGTLTPASLVWTAGQVGWMPASDTALSPLFAQLPPPLPGA